MQEDCPAEINQFTGSTKEHLKNIDSAINDMKAKVDTIQKWIWVMTGAITVLGVSNLQELTKIVLAK